MANSLYSNLTARTNKGFWVNTGRVGHKPQFFIVRQNYFNVTHSLNLVSFFNTTAKPVDQMRRFQLLPNDLNVHTKRSSPSIGYSCLKYNVPGYFLWLGTRTFFPTTLFAYLQEFLPLEVLIPPVLTGLCEKENNTASYACIGSQTHKRSDVIIGKTAFGS